MVEEKVEEEVEEKLKEEEKVEEEMEEVEEGEEEVYSHLVLIRLHSTHVDLQASSDNIALYLDRIILVSS